MLYSADSYVNDEIDFDVLVVGAGAVGLTLAVDLARKGHNVALLEAGPSKPAQSSQKYFEMARAVGHDLPGLHVGRFRCLGGTTHFWGGQLVPFAPIVFEDRDWLEGGRWPISAADIELFYQPTFDILGMKNVELDDDKLWEEIDVLSPPTTDLVQPIFTRWAPESNLVIHFEEDIKKRANLTVLNMAQVGALVVDDEEGVVGVELRFAGGARKNIMASKIILANGTVEISRLLQLPTANGGKPPWSKNSWLGRGFFDHVDTFAASVYPIDKRRFMDVFENAVINGLKYSPKLRLADDVQRQNQLLEISGHFVFNSSFSENIDNLKVLVKGLMQGRVDKSRLQNPFTLLSSLKFVVPMAFRYLRYRRIMNFSDGGIQLRLTSEQRSLKESEIRLLEERDDYDMPLVEVDWRIGSEVIETQGFFVECLRDYLQTNGLADVKIDPQLLARDPAYLAKTDDANHQMGGARMGLSPADGVVDKNCKVFGVEGLYVAGAAAFPSSGFANPTFTAMAFGLRLADHLDQSLKAVCDAKTS